MVLGLSVWLWTSLGATIPVAGAADSVSVDESAPAPLLVPGRPAPPDTTKKSPAQRAREHLELGLALERDGHPAPAIAAYNNAVLADPTVREAWFRMGHLYFTRGRLAEAVRCFRNELKFHPEHLPAKRELGLGLAQLGDTARAIVELRQVTRLRPDDDEGWRDLGFAYSVAQRPREAEKALRHAIALAPPRAIEHRDLGVLLASVGRDPEARREYRKALDLDPKDASSWYNLGNLERRGDRFEPALAAYRQASAYDSGFGLAVQGEAQVLVRLARVGEAGDVYRRWLRRRPDDHNARLDAVRLFDDARRPDIALELARDGVRNDPNSSDAHLILGMALHSRGESRSGLVEMRKAKALATTPPEREKIRRLIATVEVSSSDSLRTLFKADSAAGDTAR